VQSSSVGRRVDESVACHVRRRRQWSDGRRRKEFCSDDKHVVRTEQQRGRTITGRDRVVESTMSASRVNILRRQHSGLPHDDIQNDAGDTAAHSPRDGTRGAK